VAHGVAGPRRVAEPALPLAPPVLLRPRPWETRARIGYRVLRHVQRSARSGDLDFVGQGLATAANVSWRSLSDPVRRARHRCNVCGWQGAGFYPNTGPGYHESGVTCPGCSSLDRHRSLLALLVGRTDLFTPGQRVVEVAPMRGFEALLRAQPGLDYTSFDLERHAMEYGDITAMHYATGSVDWFLCFHVLEHIPDAAAALGEVRRVLRPGGTAVLQVPVDWDAAETREYDAPDPRDVGHVRRYGRDFPDILTRAGFEVRSLSVADSLPAEVIECYGLSPEPVFLATRPADD
jgi:SAM-dependent methyltransferase